MKIQKIDVFQVDLPYSGGSYRLSGGREYSSFDSTIVRITTECGIEGWGESTPFGATYIAAHALGVRAGISEIAPNLIGHDPRHLDRINEKMDQSLVDHNHAKTALDVACWDIFGKSVNMPVCDLLGGRTNQTLPVISSIPADTPGNMRQNVADHRINGYKGHSIKVGALDSEGGPSLDAKRITQCLADQQTGEYFLVDANGGLTVENALRMLELLPKGLDFALEAPCATLRETLSLRNRTCRPIIVDELATCEQSIVQIIASDAADGIGLKISKNGGLTKCRRQRDMCIAAGLTMSVQDTVGSEIAFAGVLHLAQTVPERYLRCVLDTRGMVKLNTAKFDVEIIHGGVTTPKLPGLGVQPKLDVLGQPIISYQSH